MSPIGIFSIISWILLPTVMFGGYFLLHLQCKCSSRTATQQENKAAFLRVSCWVVRLRRMMSWN
jgi:hypothetical protein